MKTAAAAMIVADLDESCPKAAFISLDSAGRVRFLGTEYVYQGVNPCAAALRAIQSLGAKHPDGMLLEVASLRRLVGHDGGVRPPSTLPEVRSDAAIIGHGLLFEGRVVVRARGDGPLQTVEHVRNPDTGHVTAYVVDEANPKAGMAVCRCGATSARLRSTSARQRWHKTHLDFVAVNEIIGGQS